VRTRITLFAALAAALAAPAGAQAATFTVSDDGDSGPGTLRDAINDANATPGADTITFLSSVHTIAITSTLPTVTGPVTIRDSEGDVTVSSSTAGASPLIRFAGSADGSRIERVGFTRSGGTGIEVAGDARQVTVTRSPVFGSGINPIDLLGAANDGIGTPEVRVGPRQADGTLPVSGNGPGGTAEIFRGDPRGSSPISYLASVGSDGSFGYVPPSELQPGEHVAATVTDGSGNTSEFSPTATVPSDVVSPWIAGARAVSTNAIVVQPTEPLDPGSVQLADFVVQMAAKPRAVAGGSIASDGSSLTLRTSTAWLPGEAGFLQLTGPGALTDSVGNQNLDLSAVRVAAAPGDLIAPVITSLSFKPRRMCLTKNRRCRKPGMRITFIASEKGRGKLQAVRGSRAKSKNFDVEAGRNTYRFDGTFRGKKLRAGRYALVITMTDVVGNEAAETPFKTFYVVRTTARRR
jgi:hypothetical protein